MDTQKNSSSEQATEKQTQKRKGVSDYIEILAGWIVDIISIPVSFGCGSFRKIKSNNQCY